MVSVSKVLYCIEIVPTCGESFRGESDDDVMHQAAMHASAEHGIGQVSEELAEKIRARIKDE